MHKHIHKNIHHYNLVLMLVSLVGFFWSIYVLLVEQLEFAFLIALFFVILFLESFIGKIRIHFHKNHSDPTKSHIHDVAPLSSNFMLTSILGIIVTIFVIILPEQPFGIVGLTEANLQAFDNWGTALLIVFIMMFIASMISMTKAPLGDKRLEDEHWGHLAFHNKVHRKKK